MAYAKLNSFGAQGITAPPVQIEVHLSNGLPSLSIVGLPEAAVRESKDRVRSAILNSQFEFPPRRITVNLAPADLPKHGGRYDLPIALGILSASGQIDATLFEGKAFAGELSLEGALRSVRGALAIAIASSENNLSLVIPAANAAESALCEGAAVYGADHLLSVCSHLSGEQPIQPSAPLPPQNPRFAVDMSEVVGQPQARRALEIAASGRHNLLMVGPPGSGKTMLASRLPTILPPLDNQSGMETAVLHSIAGLSRENFSQPPFRSPHHTASSVALVGGGGVPKPGEISLAHQGVLFLDELPEFPRQVLEVLREPLETGSISISRAADKVDFPAAFQLIAAMNPCPCGYLGEPRCECTPEKIRRYRSRLSGPLLDRIDLHLFVSRPDQSSVIRQHTREISSAEIRQRVLRSRELQLARQGCLNSELEGKRLSEICTPDRSTRDYLEAAARKLDLSGRAIHRVMRVARTIADVDSVEKTSDSHINEALGYRQLPAN